MTDEELGKSMESLREQVAEKERLEGHLRSPCHNGDMVIETRNVK